MFILSLLAAFTMGSIGDEGRSFINDLNQMSFKSFRNAIAGGVIFNLANILLTAAIAGAGMAVAFPVGIGLALIIGVVINYMLLSKGNPVLLFTGAALVALAIIFNALAYKNHSAGGGKKNIGKWLIVSVLAGVLMSTFYPFVASSMDLENFVAPAAGKMTPYSAFVIFSLGVLLSNLLFNTILMRRPLEGTPIRYKDYFSGKGVHWAGLLGGGIWGVGNLFNLIAAGKAGPAISYGLGQGATLVAALWGVFIWKEFKNGSKVTNGMLLFMFILFISGLGLIIYAGE